MGEIPLIAAGFVLCLIAYVVMLLGHDVVGIVIAGVAAGLIIRALILQDRRHAAEDRRRGR